MGRNSMGVQELSIWSENDEVISVARIEEGKQVLAITEKGYGKRTDVCRVPRAEPRRQGHHGHAPDGREPD